MNSTSTEGKRVDATLRHKLMAYLGGLAISMSGGPPVSARSNLESIPEPMLVELLEELDEGSWETSDLDSLMRVLAQDTRTQIRRRVAELFLNVSHGYPADVVETIAMRFAGDRDPVVRVIGSRVTAGLLSRMTELERVAVVLDWSLAEDASVRLAILRALAHGDRVLGADLAVEHLAMDESPAVRAAVADAAEARFHDDPLLYGNVIKKLSADGTRSVRRAASRAAARVHATA